MYEQQHLCLFAMRDTHYNALHLMFPRYAQEALRELYRVRSHVPREAAVHFLIGKIHRQLGNRALALRSLNHAVRRLFDRFDGQWFA
jgi:hypothetical protein